MARILLIGCGPLPGPDVRRTGFPQHRLASFAAALRREHSLRIITLVRPEEGFEEQPEGDWAGIYGIEEEAPGWLDGVTALGAQAEIIVSAGPYNPGRAAAHIAQDRPFWADLPGDPFAELEAVIQAEARGDGEPTPIAQRVLAARVAALAVLQRADAISVISEAQRLAVLGQLGLAGRLVDTVPTDRVFVVPISADFGLPAGAPRRREAGQLSLAVSGGLNTWFDEQSLMAGFELASAQNPGIRLILTGGPLPGHHSAAYNRVRSWAEGRPGVTLTGWLPQQALPAALAAAHVGLNLDRPQHEALLGSRTRLLFYAIQGLEIATTADSPLAAELIERDLALALPTADPAGFAAALLAMAASGSDGSRARRAASMISKRYHNDIITEPLLRWCAAPSRAPITEDPLLRELERLRAELDAVHRSPTWRLLSRWHRWLKAVGLG